MVPSALESYLLPADLSRASHAVYVQFIELLITVMWVSSYTEWI